MRARDDAPRRSEADCSPSPTRFPARARGTLSPPSRHRGPSTPAGPDGACERTRVRRERARERSKRSPSPSSRARRGVLGPDGARGERTRPRTLLRANHTLCARVGRGVRHTRTVREAVSQPARRLRRAPAHASLWRGSPRRSPRRETALAARPLVEPADRGARVNARLVPTMRRFAKLCLSRRDGRGAPAHT